MPLEALPVQLEVERVISALEVLRLEMERVKAGAHGLEERADGLHKKAPLALGAERGWVRLMA